MLLQMDLHVNLCVMCATARLSFCIVRVCVCRGLRVLVCPSLWVYMIRVCLLLSPVCSCMRMRGLCARPLASRGICLSLRGYHLHMYTHQCA